MTIINIEEIDNPHNIKMKPIREKQDIYLDVINQNISRRNGMVNIYTGSGGSGKSSLMLNQFKDKNQYKKVFNNIYYFCPSASFNSVAKHPFEKLKNIYHTLDIATLQDIYDELVSKKDDATKKKEKKEPIQIVGEEEKEVEEDEEKELEYSALIIDDFADALKDPDIQRYLNKMIIKARHICCSFFITLQAYSYCPKILRKQITYITIFKPKNYQEYESIALEMFNLNKQDALTLYDYIFNKPYAHLDFDTITNTIYKNFNLLKIKS